MYNIHYSTILSCPQQLYLALSDIDNLFRAWDNKFIAMVNIMYNFEEAVLESTDHQ